MKKIILQLFSICMVILLVGCASLPNPEAQESASGEISSNGITDSSSNTEEVNGFKLSEMVVKITAAGKTATFQLYDTTAASEFYAQLPLELELSNFRDTQWMLYPPQKLNVKQEEAYHDGKKGELSYYEPWGDVFMLYDDFYAGDEMHRLGIGLTGIDDIAQMEGLATIERASNTTDIIMEMNGTEVHATLNDTVTAREFIKLLPYEVTVSRATDDLCGSVSERLGSDESENSNGWKLGEIGWFGGWFTILVDNEAAFSNHSVMIIGAVDETDLPYVQSLTGRVDISIRLADETTPNIDVSPDDTITLTVNGTRLTATLADNSSAEALKTLLADGPLTIDMSDYANMEKVGSLGTSLPTNNQQITTEAGDLILYQGNALVIYYAPNSWNFTRLGKIQNITADELKEILGAGNVSVTLSLS